MHALDTPLYVTVTVMMSLHVDWHFGCAPAPLTCLAPSQCAAAVPDVSRVPFMCPSPSHDLTHVPWPPWMRPKLFQHTPPLLDMLPPSQMCPAHPSCVPVPAMTLHMRCGPLRCVPTCFNAPCPFSMHHHHPRHILASTSTGHPRSAPVPCSCHRAPMDTICMPLPPHSTYLGPNVLPTHADALPTYADVLPTPSAHPRCATAITLYITHMPWPPGRQHRILLGIPCAQSLHPLKLALMHQVKLPHHARA